MARDSMTPRERWLAVLRREKPDRVPMDYTATPEATANLLRYVNCDFEVMLAQLHIDMPLVIGPEYVGPAPDPGLDIYGRRREGVAHGVGSYDEVTNAPLASYSSVEEIKAHYRFPQPEDWSFSTLASQLKGQEHRPLKTIGSEPFLIYKDLRGDVQAYMDLVENPEIVDYCLDQLFETCYQNTLRTYEAIPGRVDITVVAEDLGSQHSLLISREHIHRFLMPHMKKMMDLVRQNGAFVWHHSDGAIRTLLADWIAAGVHILDPVQWRLPGMEREGLKRDFGDQLIFHGAMDNQYTLPFGTLEEVRREATDNMNILGAGGGFIPGPCHNIQAVTPPENIVEFYRTTYDLSWQ